MKLFLKIGFVLIGLLCIINITHCENNSEKIFFGIVGFCNFLSACFVEEK